MWLPASASSSFFVIRHSAFTLVEIIIAITIVIILSAAAIPTIRGLRDEQAARAPIEELSILAKEARLRAMKEKRPYQIVFHQGGFTASRFLSPYLQLAELNDFLIQVEQGTAIPLKEEEIGDDLNKSRTTDSSTDQVIYTKSAEGAKFEDWTEKYALPEGTTYSVQYWHETETTPIQGEAVKLWVFQPTGIVMPLKVSLEHERASYEVEFGAMTADIIKERSEVK